MVDTERTINALEAGRVLRYHAAPTVAPQTVGQHSFGVAVLCQYLSGGLASRDLLLAAVLHDTAEYFTGDVPFTVKQAVPEAKVLFDRLENEAYAKRLLLMPALTAQELAVLKIADTLEGLIWCIKTEHSPGPVRGRWYESLDRALTKFAPILHPYVIERAREIGRYAPVFPSS